MNRLKPEHDNYLRSGLFVSAIWVGVLILEVIEFSDSGSIDHVIKKSLDGNLYPIALLVASVVLLAILISKFALHFKNMQQNR